MSGKNNQITFELFVICLLIGLGTPLFGVLGFYHGKKVLQTMPVQGTPEAGKEESGTSSKENALTDSSTDTVSAELIQAMIGHEGSVEAGKAAYQGACVACHGVAADGNGPAGALLNPPARGFLDPKQNWTKGKELINVYESISKGIEGTGMAGFESSLSPIERWDIVHYLASLPGMKGSYTPMTEEQAIQYAQGEK